MPVKMIGCMVSFFIMDVSFTQKGENMEKLFKLKENNTTIRTEILAGFTTFFTMAYILFVNQNILGTAGIPVGAVFLATIIASFAGTLFMGLFANVPYALAPGMGLNAFFTYTVVLTLGFSWQEGLAMVFICGLVNILITVTKIRKLIIKAIPISIQNAISGGIGIFIAYIGLLDVAMINFDAGVPALSAMKTGSILLALFGLLLIIVLMLKKVKGAILIGIVATTIVGIPFGVVDISAISFTAGSFAKSFTELGSVFGAALGSNGIGSLFADAARIPIVLTTIFAFSLTDTFDTIGTFIGTGRKAGVFSPSDEKSLEEGSGFSSKMDKALFADSIATSIGALFGTSNTTTYVESSAGIEEGGRTGLTAVTVAVLFLLSTVLAPVVGIIPTAATAPALIIVGILMASSFAEINWKDLAEAIPAFFAGILMALTYSISTGIAFGFIFYCIVKIITKKTTDLNPVLWVSTLLFVLNFVLMAIL